MDYNLEDYLKLRGDIPFSADPFNEVDNLILCELAYADFDGIMPEDGMMSMSDLRDRFFETHSRRDLRLENTFVERAGLLLDDLADGARFGGTSVGRFFELIDSETDVQIAAMTFMLDDGTAFIAFRGTDSTLAGWKEDFNLSYLCETEGQRMAVRYLNDTAALTDRPLSLGGHSKGGNFSVYAASFCGSEIQDRIIRVYTNDGPGFRKEVTKTEGYQRIKDKVISIVPDTSIVGQLLEHEFPDIIVKSSDRGFRQHDGFTWCVEENRFVHTVLSDLGEYIRRTQTDWLSKIDDKNREFFVKTLFDLIEAAETKTFREMKEQKKRSAEKILAHLQEMPKDAQREMLRVVHELFVSGSDAAIDIIADLIGRE